LTLADRQSDAAAGALVTRMLGELRERGMRNYHLVVLVNDGRAQVVRDMVIGECEKVSAAG
jgi:hypothetical protein